MKYETTIKVDGVDVYLLAWETILDVLLSEKRKL